MRQSQWEPFGKGLVIGATMIVPGVSGGTMAMILGIYDRLIQSVGTLWKTPGSTLPFLMKFSAGAALGLFLFSTPISWMLEHYRAPTLCFFIGAVLGGIPLIGRKSGVKTVTPDVFVYLSLGVLLVLLIGKIPGNVSGMTALDENFRGILLVLYGILSAAALILPGISFSHFLLILGLYHGFLNAIQKIEIAFLAPLGIGVILGILLFSSLLEKLMLRRPKQTYLIILGFIVGSAAQIFPDISGVPEALLSLAAALPGFLLTYRRNGKWE